MLYKKASFLEDFDLPEVTHDNIKSQLIKLGRTHSTKRKQSLDSMPLIERLNYITNEVFKVLGRYKNFVKVIRTNEELDKYIDKAIKHGYMAFDTETNNSLDPLTCKLMGVCCYIPNTKPVYIPINHTKPGTDELLENQVTEEHLKEVFLRLKNSGIKLIYHNGKFDIRVCYNTIGVYLPIWWDTMLAAQLLDENELAKLKYQFKVHVDPTISSYNIEKLFTGIPYAWVDPEIFAIYAAIDAFDTYKLQQKQYKQFMQPGFEKLFNLFLNIEVPVTSVVAEMEDTGICLDTDFLKKLDDKYTYNLEKSINKLNEVLQPYDSTIRYYQSIGKLDNPINYESPQQLVIILYDILKVEPLEEGSKSTDKATLKALKIPFTEALLDYRKYSILIKTFTKPLPSWLSSKDGKLHANFNQMGKEENNVRTGRFSSTQPNLQQIPSKEKIMRMMFKASPGYCIVGGDFSAQEPRILTHMCGDPTFLDVFNTGKDPYATISSLVFKKDYWECMEHHQDGSPNPTGKALRSKAKGIMLGILYGMGPKLMSNILGVTFEECLDILDEFFNMFPKVKEFTQANENMAKTLGYVDDYMGRRRHLPDALLDEIEVRAKKKCIANSSVFIDCDDVMLDIPDEETSKIWFEKFKTNYAGKGYNAKVDFKNLAKSNGIDTFDNGAFLSKTMTQCTNARIQGGAATLTKRAMIDIYNSKELRDLGFRLLIPIHDELLGECPIENSEQVEKLLAKTMINAAKPECTVSMATDTYAVKHWYADEVFNSLRDDYIHAELSGENLDDHIQSVISNHPELNSDVIISMCTGTYDPKYGGV